MKKYLVILGTILALVACTKELQEEVQQPEKQTSAGSEIKLNITIGRADDFVETKANIKTDWAIDDEVYLLFKDLLTGENPQYLVMRRSGTGNWVGTGKNGLTNENVPTSGLLTAIFFPYGKGASIVAYADQSSPRENPTYSHYEFLFNNDPYCGYFLKAENVPFTYDQTDGLTSTLLLKIPELAENEVLVHFDTSGADTGDKLYLYQEYVRPIVFMNVMADGTVTMGKGDAGKEIPGYNDTGFRSFSGICEKKATNTDFDFMIVDETTSMLYARTVKGKTITKNKYIGLGSLLGSSWNKHAFVDLGLQIKDENDRYHRLLWATENVGTTANNPGGDHFQWGDPEPMEKRILGESAYSSYTYDYRDPLNQTNRMPFYLLFRDYYDQSWTHYGDDDDDRFDYNGPSYKHRDPEQYAIVANGVTRIQGFNWFGNDPSKMIKYTSDNYVSTVNGTVPADNKTTLEPKDDPATVNWGAPWRTPTADEWNILKNGATWTPSTVLVENGYAQVVYYYHRLVYETVSNAGASLILPFVEKLWDDNYPARNAGTYWSSTLYMPAHANAIMQAYLAEINDLKNERDQLPEGSARDEMSAEIAKMEQSYTVQQQRITNYHPLYACSFLMDYDKDDPVDPVPDGYTTRSTEAVHSLDAYYPLFRIYGLNVRPVFTLPL